MRSISSDEEFTVNDKWQSVFGVVTSKELRLYEVAPWSPDAWSAPLFVCSLLSTRLMNSSRNSELITFSLRCGTEEGIITHRFKVDTQRDLASWARAVIQGCHNSVAIRREVNRRKYIIINVFVGIEKKILLTQIKIKMCMSMLLFMT